MNNFSLDLTLVFVSIVLFSMFFFCFNHISLNLLIASSFDSLLDLARLNTPLFLLRHFTSFKLLCQFNLFFDTLDT